MPAGGVPLQPAEPPRRAGQGRAAGWPLPQPHPGEPEGNHLLSTTLANSVAPPIHSAWSCFTKHMIYDYTLLSE